MDLFAPLAAATVSAAARQLVALGYENIRVIEASSSVTVWYENRRRPDPLAALAEVLETVAQLTSPTATVSVVPLSEDQPLLDLETTSAAIEKARTTRVPLAATFGPPLDPPPGPLSPTFEHTDVIVQPTYAFDQTSFDLLARAYADAPISSGLNFFGQIQGPFYPKLGFDPPLGALFSSGWMAPDVPAVFDVGFNGNKVQAGGEVAYEIAGGYGFLKLRGGLAQDRFPELIATAEAQLPWWDLALAGGWGTYELGDWGPFATLTRTFPRSSIELGAFDSSYGLQFRGTLSIDFGPDPRPAPAAFRLVPFGHYGIDYEATAYQAAQRMAPGPSVDAFLDRMTPAYVRAHLDRLPWPARAPLSSPDSERRWCHGPTC